MLNYIIRRLLLMIPTLLGITILVFTVMALSPGKPTRMFQSMEGNLRPEARRRIEAQLEKQYGLNLPPWRQYLRWLNNVLPVGGKDVGNGWPASWPVGFKAPELGQSIAMGRPVLDVVAERLPITLLLNLISVPLVYVIAVTNGIVEAKKRGKLYDRISGTTLLALWSVPVIWAGVMFLGYFATREYFPWFPAAGLHDTRADQFAFFPSWGAQGFSCGWLLDYAWHLVLPVICMTYGGFAFLSKLMRASILENLSADFARTARAKGLTENAVLFRHVLSNSLLPLITVSAGILPGMLGGSVVVETIFSINGMGKLLVDATFIKDLEIVMCETYIVGVISLICLLIADVLYAMADPRVTYE